MKDQRPNLNAFSRLPVLSSRVHKSRMRHPPSPSIRLRIKTFDQRYLIRPLAIQKIPLMLLIRPNGKSLSHSIRVYELHRHQIAVRHWPGVCNSEWIFEDRLDGTPDVDNLRAALKELIGFFGKVVTYAVESSFIGLVNVDALHRTSHLWRILGWASNCMVENKDFGRSSAVSSIQLVSKYKSWSGHQLL